MIWLVIGIKTPYCNGCAHSWKDLIWLVNGFKCHIVMAAPCTVTAPSSNQNLMNSSSRRLDGKLRSLDDRDYQMEMRKYNSALLSLFIYVWGLLGPLISGTQKRKQKRKLWWSRKFAVGEIHNIFMCFIN